MAFIRTIKRENPFSQIDRYVFESDPTISFKAKGIMGYMLTRPDNWKISFHDLVKRAKDGKESVTSGLKELQKAGYVHYYQERTENGKFGEWIYDVYERPEFNPLWRHKSPLTENPISDKPISEKTDYSNNKINNNNLNNNNLNNNIGKNTLPYSLSEEIFKLKMPMNLRKKLEVNRDKVLSLNIDIFEFERFYNRFEWLLENCSKENIEYINQWDVEELLDHIFQNKIKVQSTTYGLMKEMAYARLHHKKENAI